MAEEHQSSNEPITKNEAIREMDAISLYIERLAKHGHPDALNMHVTKCERVMRYLIKS